ncbi:restriction endonuclease subunit S [Thermococcus gorgonarius]|uniref:Type I restriction modification DNA specificity domain-containing protein n=1 Tax=Thermococcus gorgonarius TaxID=71997 RepID=A0A2Z2M5D3_THEGO|nr:restriction endonuclease subunit S [Thermococcus gorgonarius]ASJ01167.1 hypothetical protein A3K92_06560 [Thermococcus gorgonarius]
MQTKKTPIGEIPEDWEITKLGEVVEIYDNLRVPLSEIERANRKGPYPYCGANGVIDYIDEYIFDGEYILLAEDGGYYGSFESSAYIMTGKFWVNNHAHVLKAKEGVADNWFILYVLNFLDLTPYVVGSTRKKLNQKHMKQILIPLPPLSEQRKIAEILRTIDEAIEKTDLAIERTERLKKGLMQRLLTRGIRHERFKKTELGEIPEEWRVVRLGEVAEIRRGASPRPKGDPRYFGGEIPWIKISDISKYKKGLYLIKTEDTVTEEGKSKSVYCTDGTLIVSNSGTIGEPAIIKTGKGGCIHDGFIMINPRDGVDKIFLYYFFEAKKEEFHAKAQKGTQGNMNTKLWKTTKLPLPPLSEQKQIAEILSTVDRKLELLRQRREKLEGIKRGLMKDLLTGRRRVRVE